MYVPVLGHAFRVTRVIARRLIYNKRRRAQNMVVTRVVPYMVEFINDHRLTPEHVAAIAHVIMETEVLGICVRAISIAMSMHKYVGK